jgi:anti-anti-sigma factor
MQIVITDWDNAKIVTITGDFTISTIKDYEDTVFPMFKHDGKVVAINMESIDFIDSSGISALVNSLNIANVHKKDFVLFNLNNDVQKILTKVGLNNFFITMTQEEFESKYK